MKNKITPAAAPCCDFGKQLMPFEFSVGYTMDMKSPETGSSHAAASTPKDKEPRKHKKIAALTIASAAVQGTCARSHAPRNRPAARNTKNSVSA